MKFLSILFKALRPHIFCVAGMGTLVFSSILSKEYYWSLALISAFDWCLLNLLNQIADVKEDIANGRQDAIWIERHQSSLKWVTAILIFASVIWHFFINPVFAMIRMLFHFGGFVYSFSLFGKLPRLKAIPIVKNCSSSLFFLLTCFAYPLSYLEGALAISQSGILVLISSFFIFEVCYEILYDLRDVEGDSKTGIRTIPVLLGSQNTKKLLNVLFLLASVVVLVGFYGNVLDKIHLFFAVGPVFVGLWARSQVINSEFCKNLTWFTCIILGFYLLWQRLEWLNLWGHSIEFIQTASIVLAVSYVYFICYKKQDYKIVLWNFTLLLACSWLGEQSVITFYDFYSYSEQWIKLGDVPVAVAMIWPFLIVTARNLFNSLDLSVANKALLVAVVIFLNALFVEAIAVKLGLWAWHVEGVLLWFPLIGVVGWGLYAFFVEYWKAKNNKLYFVLVLLSLHAALVTLWWSSFRWFSFPVEVTLVPVFSSLIVIGMICYRKKLSVSNEGMLHLAFMGLGFLIFVFTSLRFDRSDVFLLSHIAWVSLPYFTLILLRSRTMFLSKINSF